MGDKEKKGFTKEDLQDIGRKVWDDPDIRDKFLDEAGKFSLKRTVKSLLDYVVTVKDMFCDIKAGNYAPEDKKKWLCILGAAVYVVFPFDFIHDAFPGIGQLDDVGAVSAAILLANSEINKYKEWKRARGEEVPDVDLNDDTVVGDAEFREVSSEPVKGSAAGSGNSSLSDAMDKLASLGNS